MEVIPVVPFFPRSQKHGVWEAGLKPWDIAAGALLIRESGGLVTNFKGSDDVLDGDDIMTANPKLLKQIAASIR